jgi:hypothetical protein
VNYIESLFYARYSLDTKKVLQQGKDRIIKGGNEIKNKGYQDLEDYLNAIFYNPTTDKMKDLHTALVNASKKWLEEEIGEKLDGYNYDFATGYLGEEEDRGKIALSKYTSFNHKKYITIKELESRLQAVEAWKGDESGEVGKIVGDLEEQLKQLLEEVKRDKGINDEEFVKDKILFENSSQDIIKKVANIDNLYSQITYFQNFPISNDLLGKTFEYALDFLVKLVTEGVTDEIMNEFGKTATFGQQTANRGEIINAEGITITTSKTKEGKTKTFLELGNGDSFEVTSAFSDKQGKIDVNIKFPEINNNQPSRVSAKNWSKFSGRDFGTVNLESAMLRTVGVNPTLSYGLSVGYFSSKATGVLNAVHNYAKAVVSLDSLMGYSQLSNYADTIIINDRAARKIHVYSISSLLSKIEYDLDRNNSQWLHGYDAEEIANDITGSLNFRGNLCEQKYLSKILGALSKHGGIYISSSLLTSQK